MRACHRVGMVEGRVWRSSVGVAVVALISVCSGQTTAPGFVWTSSADLLHGTGLSASYEVCKPSTRSCCCIGLVSDLEGMKDTRLIPVCNLTKNLSPGFEVLHKDSEEKKIAVCQVCKE